MQRKQKLKIYKNKCSFMFFAENTENPYVSSQDVSCYRSIKTDCFTVVIKYWYKCRRAIIILD